MGIKPMVILGLSCLISCSDDDEPGTSSDNDTPQPISEVNVPKRNPYLAAEHYSITHFNSAQTDAFPYSVKEGTFKVDIDKCPMTWSGPVNLMTLSSTNSDYMWGMASDRVSYIYIGNGSFEKVAEAAYPTVSTKSQEDLEKLIAKYNSVNELGEVAKDILGPIPQIAMASGNYVLCDKDNYAYTNSLSRIIRYKLTDPNDPSKGITLDKEIDMKNYFSNINTLVGLSMTYDGYLVATFASGIAIVDRTLSNVVAQYALPADQTLSNSISIDENNNLTSYPEELTIDLPVYIISKPKEQLAVGDVIALERSYAKVTKISGGKITAISYTGSGKTIHTIKDFLFNQTMVRVVVSLAGNVGGQINPMLLLALSNKDDKDALLPLLMMNQNGGALGMNPMMLMMLTDKGEGTSMKDMLLLSAMSGGNMFGGMFGQVPQPAKVKEAPAVEPQPEIED